MCTSTKPNPAFAKFEAEDRATEQKLLAQLSRALIDYAVFTHPTPQFLSQAVAVMAKTLAEECPQYFDKPKWYQAVCSECGIDCPTCWNISGKPVCSSCIDYAHD